MTKPYCKFTFKAQKHGPWDTYKSIDIKYKGVVVGLMYGNAKEKWRIQLQIHASKKALAANPNCPWMWGRIKNIFATDTDAKEWLNTHREEIVAGLYYQEKDGQV